LSPTLVPRRIGASRFFAGINPPREIVKTTSIQLQLGLGTRANVRKRRLRWLISPREIEGERESEKTPPRTGEK
jgi:hypothetical protein